MVSLSISDETGLICGAIAALLLATYHSIALCLSLTRPSSPLMYYRKEAILWLDALTSTTDNSIMAAQMMRNIMGVEAVLAGVCAMGSVLVAATLRPSVSSRIPIGVCFMLFTFSFGCFVIGCRLCHHLGYMVNLFPEGEAKAAWLRGEFPLKKYPDSGSPKASDSGSGKFLTPLLGERSMSGRGGRKRGATFHHFRNTSAPLHIHTPTDLAMDPLRESLSNLSSKLHLSFREKEFGPEAVRHRCINIINRLGNLTTVGCRFLVVALSTTFVVFGVYWFLISSVLSCILSYFAVDSAFCRQLAPPVVPDTNTPVQSHTIVGRGNPTATSQGIAVLRRKKSMGSLGGSLGATPPPGRGGQSQQTFRVLVGSLGATPIGSVVTTPKLQPQPPQLSGSIPGGTLLRQAVQDDRLQLPSAILPVNSIERERRPAIVLIGATPTPNPPPAAQLSLYT